MTPLAMGFHYKLSQGLTVDYRLSSWVMAPHHHPYPEALGFHKQQLQEQRVFHLCLFRQ